MWVQSATEIARPQTVDSKGLCTYTVGGFSSQVTGVILRPKQIWKTKHVFINLWNMMFNGDNFNIYNYIYMYIHIYIHRSINLLIYLD
jgi:hypothetical protein